MRGGLSNNEGEMGVRVPFYKKLFYKNFLQKLVRGGLSNNEGETGVRVPFLVLVNVLTNWYLCFDICISVFVF